MRQTRDILQSLRDFFSPDDIYLIVRVVAIMVEKVYVTYNEVLPPFETLAKAHR